MTYGSDGGHRAFLLKGYRRHRLVWVAYVFPQFTLNCCFVEFLLHFYSFWGCHFYYSHIHTPKVV